jgi:hypothetical protein
MLEAALDLAEHGWRVFPCIPTGPKAKAPFTANGFKDATTDLDTIRQWWQEHPDALIGTPVPDALLVLDLDPRHGGTVDALEAFVGRLPITLTVWSGRADGGRHLYFHNPGGELTQTRLPTGIDLRAGGKHYVILPPSLHPVTGKPYTWELHPVATLPSLLRELLRPAPVIRQRMTPSTGSGAPLLHLIQSLKDGERNRGLFWAACRATEDGILQNITEDLVSAALAVGLTEIEARRTIASAARTAAR